MIDAEDQFIGTQILKEWIGEVEACRHIEACQHTLLLAPACSVCHIRQVYAS